jgi:hypothetical protein
MLLVVFSFWLPSCDDVSKQTDDLNITSQGVRQTLLDYHQAIKQEGLLAEFKYLDSSEEFFWVPPGYSCALAYDSVAYILRQSAPLFSRIDNSFDTLMIKPLTTSLAMYTGRLTSVSTDTAGKSSSVKLIETGLVVKRSGQWKLLSGQTAVLPD